MSKPRVEPFTPIPDWLAERTDLNASEKLIYSRILRFQKSGVDKVYPRYRWVAEVCGVSISCVQRAVEKLEEVGLLSVERRFGRSHLWRAHDVDEIDDDAETQVKMTAVTDATVGSTQVKMTPTQVKMTAVPKSECDRYPSQNDSLLRVDEESSLEEKPTMSDPEAGVRQQDSASLATGREILDALIKGGVRVTLGDDGTFRVRPKPSCEMDAIIRRNIPGIKAALKEQQQQTVVAVARDFTPAERELTDFDTSSGTVE